MGVREKRRGKGGIAIRLNMQTRGGYRIPGTRYKHAKGVRADKSVNRGISLVLNAHTKESFFPSERNFEKTLSAKKKKKHASPLLRYFVRRRGREKLERGGEMEGDVVLLTRL